MKKSTRTMMTSKDIGRLALEAMLVEVSVTPKPGLVDRNNSGAHSDMGFFTFLKSAAGLRGWFDVFAEAGQNASREGISPAELFLELRRIGIEAERDMFTATGGINTHKGEIFSLGVLSACAGYCAGEVTAEEVMRLAGEVCAGLCGRDFAGVEDKRNPTKGERVYIEHGITGIRGEAEAGYPCVRDAGLPALTKYLADGLTMNDALAFTLLHIMAVNQDTNIIARHDISTSREVMSTAQRLIDGRPSLEDLLRLDAEYISRNISPSGSADLLAATYFLYALTHSIPNC
ncbi:MAG: triphosphoribosyl-dephospho-CoA synthase CitG [Synergistaceae bacterium]|nr:triphosphoribosyl-dephospho-CoA synthase CitG [Synergistaceae bacterium]